MNISRGIISLVISIVLCMPQIMFAALSCTTTTAIACIGGTNTIVARMSGSANAHAELSNQLNAGYANNVICCNGLSGLGNLCLGTHAVVAKLSAVTNASVQQNNQSGYGNNVCISSTVPGDTVTVGYQSDNCTGYDTTVASISSADNAHIGSSGTYTTKICASISQQSLSFSVSDNSIGFGSLTMGNSRYATGDLSGSGSEIEAHQLTGSTTSVSGYTITVQGATLTSGANTITAVGATNTTPIPGVSQFGIRINASGGMGTVTAPYDASGFAYAANASTPSQVASAGIGNNILTTYSVRYVSNIAPTTASGSYTTNLVYVMTANF